MRLPDLRDRTVLVTGAGGAIGSAIAHACAAQGMRVALADLDGSAMRRAAEELGGEASGIGCDVTDEPSVEAAVSAVVERWGSLDALVTAAGVPGGRRAALDTSLADWTATLAVGLTGTFLACKHAGRVMREQRSGAIVTIGSTAGHSARLNESDYCATKAGVDHFTRVLAIECAAHGVRANAVCPGATDTPMIDIAAAREGRPREQLVARMAGGDLAQYRTGIPAGRLARPSESAAAVTFLLSDAARHITGQILRVDGGETAL